MWWRDAVIYQVYPRSFQDTDGDGIGDLRGIIRRLDHIVSLGAAAVWLSPFYPSPNADFGYDVSDYRDVDSALGTLDDFDALAAAVHERGMRLVVDFVPCHTSIEHRWFREHPDFYFWADAPPNNWRASFGGGSAWERDPCTGRFYLHSFFPEQADLNWRVPEVRRAIGDALRFWLGRGVDGFRLDALDRLLKDPQLRDDPPAASEFPLPLEEAFAALSHVHSGNAPDIRLALDAIRDAVGDVLLVGEVYLPTEQLGPYLNTLDVVFAFEAMNAGPDAARLRTAIEAAIATGRLGWVLSNHDFPRLASRFGAKARAAALLMLALPGPVFVYQGDELGTPDGPGATPPHDRAGRDRFRHPMAWDPTPRGGFTIGQPWLPPLDPPSRNVADQDADPDSTLNLFRAAIALRRELVGGARFLRAPDGVVAFERGLHTVIANLSDEPAKPQLAGEVVLTARPEDRREPEFLAPGGALVLRR